MSSIVISDLNQASILTDLSDEQVNTIQGGNAGAILATIVVVGLIIYAKGYQHGAASCKAE